MHQEHYGLTIIVILQITMSLYSIVSSLAPVHGVNICQVGNRIMCSSEEIYPQTEVSWSSIPPCNTTLQNRTKVSDRGSDQTYKCTGVTHKNKRSTILKPEVVCHFMESCILPCNLKNGDELVLHWFYTEGDLYVHSFYESQDQLGTQDQRFRDRTSLFKDQFPRHNYSLKLTEVRIQDEGRYKCLISTTTGNRYSFINLKVEAPVSKVSLSQVENRITCSSDGIYPEPELTWSINPPSSTALQNRTTVQQTDKQLYNISSSLMVSGNGSDLTYSCTVSTLGKKKTATVRQLSTNATSSVTTIHCPGSNTSTTGLIWRFNQTQIILNQTKANLPLIVSDEWRKHVKDVSESGSLTLQDITSDQDGVYTCEVSKEDETIITNISVRISPENPASVVGIISGVIIVLAIIAVIIITIIIWNRRKNEGEAETGL